MSVKQRKIQLELAFGGESRGEAPTAPQKGTETLTAKPAPESPASNEKLMEEVCQRDNLKEALKQVSRNKGGPGIDGMTVEELPDYLKDHWPDIKGKLLKGKYEPQPVKRVEIPKPSGGVRKLGIPTVLDRFIQQSVMQVLQKKWDKTFSEHSYGFRPGRSAHKAVKAAQGYILQGYNHVVDIDLEKFFDRVNHDILMSRISKRESDKRMLKLIRSFLTVGVMEKGLVGATDEGTPQGGPLSPLLSNLMLDDLDKELEKRGHKFVRYADDANIYVKSRRSGERVMEGIATFLTKRLKLTVNREKSAVARPSERKFLGFSFTWGKAVKRRISPQALKRFRERIKEVTRRTRGVKIEEMIRSLSRYLNGWRAYYSYCETPTVLRALDEWVRRRLRSVAWKQWKTWKRRLAELIKLGVRKDLAAQTAGSGHGPWRISRSPALHIGMPNAYFKSLGLPRLERLDA